VVAPLQLAAGAGPTVLPEVGKRCIYMETQTVVSTCNRRDSVVLCTDLVAP